MRQSRGGAEPAGGALARVLAVGLGHGPVEGAGEAAPARRRARAASARSAGRSAPPRRPGSSRNCQTPRPVARSAARTAWSTWFRWSFSPVMLSMSRPFRTNATFGRAVMEAADLDHVVEVVAVEPVGAGDDHVVASPVLELVAEARRRRRVVDLVLGDELEEARLHGQDAGRAVVLRRDRQPALAGDQAEVAPRDPGEVGVEVARLDSRAAAEPAPDQRQLGPAVAEDEPAMPRGGGRQRGRSAGIGRETGRRALRAAGRSSARRGRSARRPRRRASPRGSRAGGRRPGGAASVAPAAAACWGSGWRWRITRAPSASRSARK